MTVAETVAGCDCPLSPVKFTVVDGSAPSASPSRSRLKLIGVDEPGGSVPEVGDIVNGAAPPAVQATG